MIQVSRIFAFFVATALLVYGNSVGSQSVGRTTVLAWAGGKKAAVSLSFDDNLVSQLDIAIPEMEKHGLRGTFFIVAQWLDDFATWDGLATRWKEAAKRGHEIGSHSYSHRYLTWVDDEELAFQVVRSKEVIERWIGEGNCRIFRHPWGDRDQRTNQLVGETYLWNSDDLPAYTRASGSGERDVTKLRQMIERTIAEQGWFVSVFHGVGRDFMSIPLSDFRSYLTYLDTLRDSVWVAPMGEVICYATERQAARVLEKDGIRVLLPDTLDSSVFNMPLTLETRLPKDWRLVKIRQGNRYRLYTTLEDGEGRFVRYEGMPNGDPIVVEHVKALSTDNLRLVRMDSFAFEGKGGLSRWEVVQGKWEVTEGILSAKDYACKMIYPKPLTDFMVRGRFKILGAGREHSSFSFSGFFLRCERCLPAENNGIYYELDNHSSISDFRSNRVLLWHQWTARDGEKTPWYWPDRLVATFPAEVGVDEWHTFEIWARGCELLYLLDDKPALVYGEMDLPEGRFGLRNRGSEVWFDEIEIFEIR